NPRTSFEPSCHAWSPLCSSPAYTIPTTLTPPTPERFDTQHEYHHRASARRSHRSLPPRWLFPGLLRRRRTLFGTTAPARVDELPAARCDGAGSQLQAAHPVRHLSLP